MASIQDLSVAYFRSMNSLAEKISNDVLSTQDAYQDLWYKLSDEEKKQVLNEAIIDPAAVLKYDRLSENNHAAWTENPQSDFSWFTKSQLNLFTVSTLRGEKMKTPIKKSEPYSPAVISSPEMISDSRVKNQNDGNLLNKLKNKVAVLKTSTNEERQSLVESKTQINLTPKMIISKPKTPPPPPPVKPPSNITVTEKRALLSNGNESDHSEDIPKTGFDFLDNW